MASSLDIDYANLMCNNTADRYKLSKLCVNESLPLSIYPQLDCVPNIDRYDESDGNQTIVRALRISLGVWCIFVAVAGILGNLLTLLALPFAREKRRHRLHESWNTSTIFILNLAAVDLIFCIICIPTFSIPFLTQRWTYGNMPCNGK